jgi:putative endonuclease
VFYVYVISSLSGTLYVGLTDDLRRRLEEHRLGLIDGFTKKYKVNRPMYHEIFRDAQNAERREKQIKKYRREKKIALFIKGNLHWEDRSKEFSASCKEVLVQAAAESR